MTNRDLLIGLFIVCLWGGNFVVIAWGLNDFPPFLLGASRFILIALIGSLFVRKPDIPIHWLAMYGLTIGFAQFAFLFWGMSIGMPAGIASIVLQSQVIFSTLLATICLNENISRSKVFAIVISTFGLILIGSTINSSNLSLLGFLLTVAASISWAIGNVLNKRLANLGHNVGVDIVVWSSWFTIPFFILTSLYFEGADHIYTVLREINCKVILVLLYLSVGASILGFGLWSKLLTKYPASLVTPLSLGVPVVGLISASVFLGEKVELRQAIGMVVLILGLLLSTCQQRTFKY